MEHAGRNLEHLDEHACRVLLGGHSLGRVAVTTNALPAIFPVNYAMLDGDVVFRTAAGAKLHAAIERAVIAFEADGVDQDRKTGWSVLVVGAAIAIEDALEVERARALALRSWAPGERDRFVRLDTQMISGRRILD